VTDLVPSARNFAREEWWIGWIAAITLAALVGVFYEKVDDFGRAARVAEENLCLQRENNKLRTRLDALKQDQEIWSGSRPSEEGLSLSSGWGNTYPLCNLSAEMTASDIEVHSLTPEVEVLPLHAKCLLPADVQEISGHDGSRQVAMNTDMVMVEVRFENDVPVDWHYRITYVAERRTVLFGVAATPAV